MFLSNRDLAWAIECGTLIVDPKPTEYGESSIDLHLDKVSEARIWDVNKFQQALSAHGTNRPELRLGTFDYRKFSAEYFSVPPEFKRGEETHAVVKRGNEIIVRPNGFLLWQTKETVGTPRDKTSRLVCFVNAKSTRARTGLVVHLTAPTIHVAWSGQITLEIANFGPFDFVLQEDDIIAQITVATVSSVPDLAMTANKSQTYGQTTPSGSPQSR